MIQPEDILEVMGRQAKAVCSQVYPQNRPNAVSKRHDVYIVVALPYSPVNKTLGEDDDWWVDQTVVFELYVADKKGAADPRLLNGEVMKEKRSAILALFPIVDYSIGIKITRPRVVIPASSDGEGYHYTRVQARMSTLI